MDKFKGRVGIPGHKELGPILNESAHGEMVASRRYGHGTQTFPPPEDPASPQRLGDDSNLQGNRYGNNTRPGWLRGSNEDATTKENFDPRDKSGNAKKW